MLRKFGLTLAALLLVGGGCLGMSEEEVSTKVQTGLEAEGIETGAAAARDLSSCGDFPKADEGGFPSTGYAVCKHGNSGACYYKMSLPRPKPGCDMEFGTYRSGNPACFTYVAEVFGANGKKIAASEAEYRTGDTCATTTVEYFNTKVDYKS